MSKKKRPILFGEVLFDISSDGAERLGGAPFNVAWALKGFGLDPLLITRVGNDDRGAKIVEAMAAWGLDTAGVQYDERRPTGVAQVVTGEGVTRFDIPPGAAWDFVDTDEALDVVGGEPFLLYHGLLAARNDVSMRALWGIRNNHRPSSFVDVNLRPPWTPDLLAQRGTAGVNYLKVNSEELCRMAGAPTLAGSELEKLAVAFQDDRFHDLLIVTCHHEGAFLVDEEGITRSDPPKVEKVVDAIGAGDAFSAVVMLGLLSGWERRKILDRALAFSAATLAFPGGVSEEKERYAPLGAGG